MEFWNNFSQRDPLNSSRASSSEGGGGVGFIREGISINIETFQNPSETKEDCRKLGLFCFQIGWSFLIHGGIFVWRYKM